MTKKKWVLVSNNVNQDYPDLNLLQTQTWFNYILHAKQNNSRWRFKLQSVQNEIQTERKVNNFSWASIIFLDHEPHTQWILYKNLAIVPDKDVKFVSLLNSKLLSGDEILVSVLRRIRIRGPFKNASSCVLKERFHFTCYYK